MSVEFSEVAPSRELGTLAEAADRLGVLLQYVSPGFLRNIRQHRQFGLAVIQVAQLCRQCWTGTGVRVPNSVSSVPTHRLPTGVTQHPCGWRDVFDVVVRWRQLSEPFDPVWWIDGLTPQSFEEGFGLQTPMVSGQSKVVRYYPQFQTAFPLFKRLIAEQCPLTDSMRDEVLAAKTCDDVYLVMQRDFWVVTPCHSSIHPGKVYEGTRLTLVATPPGGHDFTIRTPCTPQRAAELDKELEHFWEQLCQHMRKPKDERDEAEVKRTIAAIYFYWINLGPLTRGTSAVGLAALVGMSLAADLKLFLPTPEGKQLDWEAILTATVDKFYETTKGWIYGGGRGAKAAKARVPASLPEVQSVVPNMRTAWKVLNIARKTA